MTATAVKERADAAITQAVSAARAAGRATVDRAAQAATRENLRQLTDQAWQALRLFVRRTGLTDFGISVVLLGVACFAIGTAMSWRELTLIGVGGVAVVAVCVVYTLAHADVTATLNLSNRRLRVTPEAKVATVTVSITNASTSRPLRPLRILVPCGEDRWSPRTSTLSPGQTWSAGNPVPGRRRGVVTVGPVSTVRADPLGLFRHEKEVAEATEIIVHPRTVRLDPLGSGLLRDLEGQATRTIVSHDLEFHALREYVPGDDRRHIHWRTSARTGRYMVRQFVDTRSSHLAVIVSGAKGEYENEAEFETALSVGASIATRASHDSQTVSVLAAGHTATPEAKARLLDPFSRAEWGSRRSLALRPMIEKRAARLGGVTVGIVIAGSTLDAKQVQRAGEPLGPQVKLVGIRVGADGGRAVVTGGTLTMLSVARLEDLPRVLRALS
ncbi:MAG TPA: DUF58 domain-containing protein [Micromonosporaceae bacterium]